MIHSTHDPTRREVRITIGDEVRGKVVTAVFRREQEAELRAFVQETQISALRAWHTQPQGEA